MLNMLSPIKEIMREGGKKALITRTKPETANSTHSVVFLLGCEQKMF